MNAQSVHSSIDPVMEKLYQILSKEYEQLARFVHVLKEEQKYILDRKTLDLTAMLPKIQEELLKIQSLQVQRENVLQGELSLYPSEEHPGIAARLQKIDEPSKVRCIGMARKVEEEFFVVQEIGRQNQLLLSRSVHFIEEVLVPLTGTKRSESLAVYGQQGRLQHRDVTKQSIFQGVG